MAFADAHGARPDRDGPAPISTKFGRAKKDSIGALLAACCAAGLRFRWSGATLEVDGLGRLSDRDQALFQTHEAAVLARLAAAGDDGTALLDQLGVWCEMVRTPEDAARVIAELPPSCGLDVETAPRPEYRTERPWLVVTKKGERAKHQPDPKDRSSLDPHKARARMVQIYSPEHEAVFLFDLDYLTIEALADLGLFSNRKLVAHNAAFECMMLRAHEHGIELVDSMQLAGLVLGCEFGARALANVAQQTVGVELPKEQQLSDWGARLLSRAQCNYAAADAVVCHLAARTMWRQLSRQEHRCFEVQNRAIAAIARMRLTGCPFVPEIHKETIERWEIDHAENRAEFKVITGEEPPARDKVGAWLETHLPAEEIAWMPRTRTGTVSARSDLLKHLAHHEEIRPLLRVLWSDKRLRSFGYKLLEAISPATGRVHPDFMLGSKAGRLCCTRPDFQQLPPDVRVAVVAPVGRLLVVADYNQIELRVLAELSGDAALRAEFEWGGDVHRAAAAAIAAVRLEDVTDEQRQAAKAAVFGVVFGSGANRIGATAWANFGVDLTLEQAGAAREALLNRYPGVRQYQRHQADVAEAAGVVRSILGRPLKAEWEGGQIRYTQAVNFPVQSSAADVMLIAMAKVERALPGAMVLQVHDELVVEVAEQDALTARDRLVEAMIEAFLEVFPEAPATGLVDVAVVDCWAEAKA